MSLHADMIAAVMCDACVGGCGCVGLVTGCVCM